jgi:hypothetical protein
MTERDKEITEVSEMRFWKHVDMLTLLDKI